MASYSVGFPPGSPPPMRAATSMFLISRANILPRRASMTAFLCFVVAHLEWPLIVVLSRSVCCWPAESRGEPVARPSRQLKVLVVDRRAPMPTPAPPAVGERAHRRVPVVQQARVDAVTVQKHLGVARLHPVAVEVGVEQRVDVDRPADRKRVV